MPTRPELSMRTRSELFVKNRRFELPFVKNSISTVILQFHRNSFIVSILKPDSAVTSSNVKRSCRRRCSDAHAARAVDSHCVGTICPKLHKIAVVVVKNNHDIDRHLKCHHSYKEHWYLMCQSEL